MSVRTRFGENQTSAEVAIPGLPAKPASVNAYRGQNYIDAEWSAVSGATGYDVRYRGTNVGWTTVLSNAAASTLKTQIPLNVHHTFGEYVVAVRARENNAIGPWKNSAPARGIQNPHWVTNLTTARSTSGEIDVSWNICDISLGSCNGYTPITHYAVNLSADGGQSWTRVQERARQRRRHAQRRLDRDRGRERQPVLHRRGRLDEPPGRHLAERDRARRHASPGADVHEVDLRYYSERLAGDHHAVLGEAGRRERRAGLLLRDRVQRPDQRQRLDAHALPARHRLHQQSVLVLERHLHRQPTEQSIGQPVAIVEPRLRHRQRPEPEPHPAHAACRRSAPDSAASGSAPIPRSQNPPAPARSTTTARSRSGGSGPSPSAGDYAYDVQCSTSSNTPYTWSDCHTEAASQTANFYVSPSVTGTATNVRFRAGQAQRVSGWVSVGVPSGTAPAAPGNVAVSSVSTVGTTVTYTIGWDKPSGASGALSYVVQCSSDNSTWSQCATVAATSSSSLTATTTLTTSQTAWTHVRVRADQGYLRGAWSSSASTVSLSAGSITATSATLTIANHTAAWYYKSTTTGQTTCTSVAANTSSVTLSDLSPGASYTFSAYSDSACTTANLLAAAAAFTTPLSLTASAIADTTTTLTIAGHTAQWWYKANAAPHTTCQGPVAGQHR